MLNSANLRRVRPQNLNFIGKKLVSERIYLKLFLFSQKVLILIWNRTGEENCLVFHACFLSVGFKSHIFSYVENYS